METGERDERGGTETAAAQSSLMSRRAGAGPKNIYLPNGTQQPLKRRRDLFYSTEERTPKRREKKLIR